MGIRDFIRTISPTWLIGGVGTTPGVGERTLYLPGIALDMLLEKMDQGMKMHMPGYCDPSALPFIGADRLIVRGIGESDDSYAQRLKQASTDHGFQGAPRTDLRETLAIVLPLQPGALTVESNPAGSTSSVWNQYLPGADTTQEPSHYLASPSNFDWDSNNLGGGARWWRTFIVYFSVAPNTPFTAKGKMGASGKKMGASGSAMGINEHASIMQTMMTVLAQWKSAGTWFQWAIISFDGTIFQPSAASTPDGYWGRWCKLASSGLGNSTNVYVKSRSESARYANGPS